jgi:hypothetical protein
MPIRTYQQHPQHFLLIARLSDLFSDTAQKNGMAAGWMTKQSKQLKI